MPKIKLRDVRRRVKALAAERPDFVYVEPEGAYSCVYFKGGAPSCIVGHALADELKAAGVDEDSDLNDDPISRVAEQISLEITPKALDYLSVVQWNQDNAVPWAEAVERAESAR